MPSQDLTIEDNFGLVEHHLGFGDAGLMLFHLDLARKQADAGDGFTEAQKSQTEQFWKAAHLLATNELTGDFFHAGVYYNVGRVAGAMVQLAYLAATAGLTPRMVSNLGLLSREPDHSFTESIMPDVPRVPVAGVAQANMPWMLGRVHEPATHGRVEAVNELLAMASAFAEQKGYQFSPEEQEYITLIRTTAAAALIIQSANSGISHQYPMPWHFFGPCMRFVHSGLLSFTEVVDAYTAAALRHANLAGPDNGHASKAHDYLIFLREASLDGVDLQPWVAQLENGFAETVQKYSRERVAHHVQTIETAITKAEQGLTGMDSLANSLCVPLETPASLRRYIETVRAVQRVGQPPVHVSPRASRVRAIQ